MLASPSIALTVPLKILVWKDSRGRVWLSYNGREYLKKRHDLPMDLVRNIAGISVLATEVGAVSLGLRDKYGSAFAVVCLKKNAGQDLLNSMWSSSSRFHTLDP